VGSRKRKGNGVATDSELTYSSPATFLNVLSLRAARFAGLFAVFWLVAQVAGAAIVVDPLSVGATDVSFGTSPPGTPVTNPVPDPLSGGVLVVGRALPGTLEINLGSQANIQTAWIGNYQGSPGVLTVEGMSSQLSASSNVEVGSSGYGKLEILDGGHVTARSLDVVSNQLGSPSQLSLSGSESSLAVSQTITVQRNGVIATGGGTQIEANRAYVGFFATANDEFGAASVGGADSKWTVHQELRVGDNGNGSLTIFDGGEVVAGAAMLGGFASTTVPLSLANGTLRTDALYFGGSDIQGAGSVFAKGMVADIALSFDAAHDLVQQIPVAGQSQVMLQLDHSQPGTLGAGYRGNGSLTIADSRVVHSAEGILGYGAGSFGQALVQGAGSKWQIDGDLQAGVDGAGELKIGAGGMVDVGGRLLLGTSGGSPSSRVLIEGGDLFVNVLSASADQLQGTGTIHANEVHLDAQVVFDQPGPAPSDLVLDELPGQQVTVDFGGPELGHLGLGYRSNGSLEVRNGAQVHSTSGSLGQEPGGRGTALVEGPGSTWSMPNGELMIGSPDGEATSELVTRDGGLVESQQIDLNSRGSIEVAGQNARVQSQFLYLNRFDNGSEPTLHIHSGGMVSTAFFRSFGGNGALEGNVLVEGQDSRLEIQYNATLNSALVRVRDGAVLSLGDGTGSPGDLDLQGGTLHLDGGVVDLQGGNMTVQNGEFLFEHGTLRDFRQFNGDLLQIGGAVELNGVPAQVTGGYYQDADAVLRVSFQQSSSERLQVTRTSLLSGTLEVDVTSPLPTSTNPAEGIFAVLRSEQRIVGTFENYVLPELVEGLDWSVVQTPTELQLQIIAGDYNGDGTVNAADYTLWRNSRGQQVEMGSGADGNRNGFIDEGDYQLWEDFFGRVVVGGSEIGGVGAEGIDAVAVPESTSGIHFLAGLVMASTLRRRGW